ncbi:PAS domain S-box protein [Halorubrum vacuolatum]|uniref:histidine kinase n=1 Tax=Halorubrum vacuolatum TaxID=63740 RepID=A0A238Y2Q1_HALVU|nr:PAS domain S-box protein [Halorubrum vacuolatum]SNR65495.1 PAS domain S-box-containing protein [Halorubrum vacuolatum]
MWQYHPILLVFILGGFISLAVAVYCLTYIRDRGFSYLVASIGLIGFHVAIYTFAASVKTASTDLNQKVLFYQLEIIGSGVVPSIAVIFALALVGWDRWITRGTIGMLAVVPLIGVPLFILNPGEVMITEPRLVEHYGIYALEHEFTIWFTMLLAWTQFALAVAGGIIIFGERRGLVRREFAMFALLAIWLPPLVTALKVTGIYPPGGDGVNLTPAFAGAMLGLFAYSIFRYRIFQLQPIGRDRAVEEMADGYLLVGPNGLVLDANPSAVRFLTDSSSTDVQYGPADELLPTYTDIEEATPVRFDRYGRTIEIRRSTAQRQREQVGRLYLLRDVTEQQEYEHELQRYERVLENVPVGVYRLTTGDEERLLYGNQALVDIFGAESTSELQNYSVSDFYVDPEDYRDLDKRLLSERTITDEVLHMQRVDGEQFWASMSSTRIFEDGEAYIEGAVQDITERIESQQALRRERMRLQAVTEAVPDLVISFDNEGRYQEVLSGETQLLPKHPDILLGEAVEAGLDVETADLLREALERTLETNEMQVIEYDYPVDGEQRWFEGRFVSLSKEWVVLFAKDVTESKVYEQRLERQNKRLRSLFETTQAAIVEYVVRDGESVAVAINDSFTEMFGYDESDVLDRPIDHLVVPPEQTEEASHLNEQIERGEHFQVEVTREAADGKRPFMLQHTPINTGSTVRGYVSYMDLSELKERERELEELTTRLELALDETNTGVWEWDLRTDELFWDESSRRLWGYERGEFSGMYEEVTNRVHPEDLPTITRKLQQAIESRMKFRADFQIILPSGKLRWIESRGIVVFDEHDDPERMIGVQTDVTERKRVELAIEEQNKKLELLNQIIRHDIRNEANVTLGLVQRLQQDNSAGDESIDERLDRIEACGKRIVDLTEATREVMNVVTQFGETLEPVSLPRVLEREFVDIEMINPDAELRLETDIPDVEIRANDMLGSLFRNLLVNAIKHNDTSTPTIAVSIERDDAEVSVTIEDNGPGIPTEKVESVFEEGVTLRGSEGTGFGLSLVRTLVKQYGGSVTVSEEKSELGGARITVTLPVVSTAKEIQY